MNIHKMITFTVKMNWFYNKNYNLLFLLKNSRLCAKIIRKTMFPLAFTIKVMCSAVFFTENGVSKEPAMKMEINSSQFNVKNVILSQSNTNCINCRSNSDKNGLESQLAIELYQFQYKLYQSHVKRSNR